MANNKDFLVVLRISQAQGPGIIPVITWDWEGNSSPEERWELLACGLMVDLAPKSIASDRVIDAEVPPSMPTAPEAQEVTLEDFPEKDAPVVAKYAGPAEYLERTGKRFRMTKDQKDRGLSRDDAFTEFVSSLDG